MDAREARHLRVQKWLKVRGREAVLSLVGAVIAGGGRPIKARKLHRQERVPVVHGNRRRREVEDANPQPPLEAWVDLRANGRIQATPRQTRFKAEMPNDIVGELKRLEAADEGELARAEN